MNFPPKLHALACGIFIFILGFSLSSPQILFSKNYNPAASVLDGLRLVSVWWSGDDVLFSWWCWAMMMMMMMGCEGFTARDTGGVDERTGGSGEGTSGNDGITMQNRDALLSLAGLLILVI